MGCGPQSGYMEGKAGTKKLLEKEKWKGEALHSKIRWNKIEAVESILKCRKASDLKDPKNGNEPIHISAQNGFIDLTKLLLKKKANVDAQNNKNNTPLHMAMEYDCYWCAVVLLEAGADKAIVNSDGFQAITGLSGTKKINGLTAFNDARNSDHLKESLGMILAQTTGNLVKSDLVQTWLKHKKELKEEYFTDEIEAQFKDLIARPDLFLAEPTVGAKDDGNESDSSGSSADEEDFCGVGV